MKIEPTLQVLIQDYFTDYLRSQKNVSAHTVSSYRDAFIIFFEFAEKKLRKGPTEINLNDLLLSRMTSVVVNNEKLI